MTPFTPPSMAPRYVHSRNKLIETRVRALRNLAANGEERGRWIVPDTQALGTGR